MHSPSYPCRPVPPIMPKFVSPRLAALLLLAMLAALSGCSPKYNWREIANKDAGFTVLLPDKPASLSRLVNLNGETVTMTMTAAEVDDISFAVGTARLSDAKLAPTALVAMKSALVANIGGKIKRDSSMDKNGAAAAADAIDIEATGSRASNGEPLLLLGHFEAKGSRVYQVVVLGNEKTVPREEATTFLSSFKLQ